MSRPAGLSDHEVGATLSWAANTLTHSDVTGVTNTLTVISWSVSLDKENSMPSTVPIAATSIPGGLDMSLLLRFDNSVLDFQRSRRILEAAGYRSMVSGKTRN